MYFANAGVAEVDAMGSSSVSDRFAAGVTELDAVGSTWPSERFAIFGSISTVEAVS